MYMAGMVDHYLTLQIFACTFKYQYEFSIATHRFETSPQYHNHHCTMIVYKYIIYIQYCHTFPIGLYLHPRLA